MNRKSIAIVVVFLVVGLVFPATRWPNVRTIQILLPFLSGLIVGVSLIRGIPRLAGPRNA